MRQLQPLRRHPQADQRHHQHVGVVGTTRFGVEQRDRALEPLAVEGEAGAALPELGEEAGQHQFGPARRGRRGPISPRASR